MESVDDFDRYIDIGNEWRCNMNIDDSYNCYNESIV